MTHIGTPAAWHKHMANPGVCGALTCGLLDCTVPPHGAFSLPKVSDGFMAILCSLGEALRIVLINRMLEAAMLGIPYQARPSARSSAWMPAGPPAPEVVAGRQIRNEQDAAYQESLMVRAHLICGLRYILHLKMIVAAMRQTVRFSCTDKVLRVQVQAFLSWATPGNLSMCPSG